ncbi:MAG: ClcB-like voltage-gated chloride channel protein [Burkholderiaceae bacterium]
MLRNSVYSVRQRIAGYSWLSDMPAMLCWAALAGVTGAFATLAFHQGILFIQQAATGTHGSIVAVTTGLSGVMRVVFPTVGGLIAGALLVWASRLQAGTASDYMEAVAIGDGRLSVRQGLLRSLSSLFTVATGGSIGREGAMVHLASLSASIIGRFASFNTARLRLLTACGAAAGVAAAYGSPIAGALFVAEIVIGTMSMRSVGPLLVAAASANITMRVVGSYRTIYPMESMPEILPLQVLPFVALGVITGLCAPYFLRLLDLVRQGFRRTRLPLPLRLAAGGFLLGLLLLVVPQVAGNGFSVVYSLLHTSWTWQAVVFILLCKVAATAVTVGSGAVGGVFTPALFVGGAIGTLFGQLMQAVLPDMAAQTYMYTLVGMGSFLGAATSAPFMALLMIFEMTLSYQIVLPLMLACVVSFFVSRALAEVSMYNVTQVREKDSLLRYRLRNTRIDELIKPADTVVRPGATVGDALAMFLEYPVRYIYVVTEDNIFQGVVAQQDLTGLLLSQGDMKDKPVTELMRTDYLQPLHPGMTLDQAQDLFVSFRGERLPVLTREEQPRLLGVVYKSSVLERYSALKRSLDASPDTVLDFSTRKLP